MAQIPLGNFAQARAVPDAPQNRVVTMDNRGQAQACLLYTSDAADE